MSDPADRRVEPAHGLALPTQLCLHVLNLGARALYCYSIYRNILYDFHSILLKTGKYYIPFIPLDFRRALDN